MRKRYLRTCLRRDCQELHRRVKRTDSCNHNVQREARKNNGRNRSGDSHEGNHDAFMRLRPFRHVADDARQSLRHLCQDRQEDGTNRNGKAFNRGLQLNRAAFCIVLHGRRHLCGRAVGIVYSIAERLKVAFGRVDDG